MQTICLNSKYLKVPNCTIYRKKHDLAVIFILSQGVGSFSLPIPLSQQEEVSSDA
jgi:hypothetical protein